ncbi:YraN family protein [Geobacter sp.]|uniref:YraN family protein n=1 Tax=Geobacter sp. TaxID=46610 RepID=UPI002607D37C|nr:YraN family protein [Geobacter sp.]
MTSVEGRHNKLLGTRGEDMAVSFLEGLRYRILERNFRCKAGEVDIVAQDGKTLVFVEVKTRRTAGYGPPQLAVTSFKQRQISKAALTWLAARRRHDSNARFDVVAITFKPDAEPDIEHFVNAFDLCF